MALHRLGEPNILLIDAGRDARREATGVKRFNRMK